MAQQDTGLGWSALSEWMVSVSGQIATLNVGGPSSGTVVPYYPDDPRSNPTLANSTALKGSDNYPCNMFAVTTPNADVCIFKTSDTGYTYVCANRSGVTYNRWWAERADRASDIYFNIWISSYDSTTGLYYNMSTGGAWFTGIPTFPNLATALATYKSTQLAVTKDNAGYTVACDARWKTSNGTEMRSPILISSDTDFVKMSGATGYNFAKYERLLSGIRFYMGFWDTLGNTAISSNLQQVNLVDRGNIDLDQLFMTIASTSFSHIIIINSPDPYEEQTTPSGEEGGDGEDLEDDEMGISHHAIPAAINTGFCRIYCPSEQQLRDLSNFLWSAQFDITAVKKLFANPMDSVLGLSAVPLNLSGANSRVYLGGVDTEMSLPMVSDQSYQVPMGAITVDKRWGSYLDYDPYTKFSIFLPFIGFKDLSADDIMGKQIILDYDVDILSGACTARLQAGGNVLYQWSGQCSIQLPVTASNWNQVFQSATSAALSAGLAVATGSAGPVLAGALAAEGAQAIMGKPRIERGGTASGAAGWMGGLTPYLVRVTPEAIIPNDQNKFIGYPAFSSISLGALTGYNEISSIHLEGIPATGAELDELETILKGGVIF